jgi:regulator of protease activity HflC (stomatin/prohibitin superfamily)
MASDMNDYFNKKKNQSGGFDGGDSSSPKAPRPPKIDFNFGGGKSVVLYFIVGFLLLMIIAKPFVIVQEGERGILSTNGKYQDQALLPGLHFIIPIIQRVYLVDTKVRIINYASGLEKNDQDDGMKTKPAVTVLDRRGLPVSIELTVQYRLNAEYAARTISNWGFTWEDKIINPVVRDVVRNVVGNYDAESLPNERNTIATKIEDGIRDNVKALPNSPAILQSIQLREIVLPEKVKEQIERVQIAKQEVQKAEQEVAQAQQQALKRAVDAEGKAKAITIEAQANAKANELISKSLTHQLLQLEQIKVQGKFNDALSQNKDAKIFLTPGGSTPNIWVDMKDSKDKITSTTK